MQKRDGLCYCSIRENLVSLVTTGDYYCHLTNADAISTQLLGGASGNAPLHAAFIPNGHRLIMPLIIHFTSGRCPLARSIRRLVCRRSICFVSSVDYSIHLNTARTAGRTDSKGMYI